MLLSELIEDLSNGELDEVNLGHNEETGVTQFNSPKLINHINSGLIDLYTRFPIKHCEVIIKQYTNIKMYRLHYDYAQTNTESTKPYKYIEDTEEQPFNDQVLKIDRVYSGDGCELPLNNDYECDSLYTPSIGTLQIPDPEHPNVVSVIYRAAPERLKSKCNEDQEIDLPIALTNALVLYVTACIYRTKLDQVSAIKSANYFAQYEENCRLVERHGLLLSDSNTNVKLERNGWV